MLPHLAIQKAIIGSLPNAQLEIPFPEIRRIADVVYFPQKIIFEVQCSPISLEEVQKRNRDYGSLGYHVIWILHDHHFNKKILSPAELYLRKNLAYYTSMTPFGHGFFYDQLEFIQDGARVYRGKPHILKDFLPRPLEKMPLIFPKYLQEKLKKSPLYLLGDAVDSLITNKEGQKAAKLEKNLFASSSQGWLSQVFQYLLKRACSSASHRTGEG